MEAPVEKGQVIGKVKIVVDDKDEILVDIKACETVEERDVQFYFMKFIEEIMSIKAE